MPGLEKHHRILGSKYLKLNSHFRCDGPSKCTWHQSQVVHSPTLGWTLPSSVTGSTWDTAASVTCGTSGNSCHHWGPNKVSNWCHREVISMIHEFPSNSEILFFFLGSNSEILININSALAVTKWLSQREQADWHLPANDELIYFMWTHW